MQNVINEYFSDTSEIQITPINTGLINQTYHVIVNQKSYILQSINTDIFKNPQIITRNILNISSYLQQQQYPKAVINCIANKKGEYITEYNNKHWRLTTYIANSVCFDTVQNSDQAFEAAKALSEFHKYLLKFPTSKIESSIPGFLDYNKRVEAFNLALQTGNLDRIKHAETEIQQILDNMPLVSQYLEIQFPERIVHADAKISNFLFDSKQTNHVLAIIDWDTLLPGNILCDFGDMIRTYANLKSEDDPDAQNNFSIANYIAVKKGFLTFLENKLTQTELQAIDLTAKVVVLIQAIRFLTDYFNNDSYYYTSYSEQNLNRTKNQLNLLHAIQSFS
jgi:Ser/Thr protein kinase RdoA (MazF antagonist)